MVTLIALALVGDVSVVWAQSISPPVAIASPRELLGGVQPKLVQSGSFLVVTWSVNDVSTEMGWGSSSDGGLTWLRGRFGPDYYNNLADDYSFGAATSAAGPAGQFISAYRTIGRHDFVHRVIVQQAGAGSSGINWQPPVTAVTFDPSGGQNADSPWLARDPATGYLYLAYVRHTLRPYAYLNGPADQPVYLVRSLDGGATWSAPMLVGGPAALGSRVEVGESGQVYVCWQDYASQQVMLRRSDDHGATFADALPVGRFVDNSRTWMRGLGAAASYSGRQHPLNYYESGNVFDFPQLAVDRSNGPLRGTLYMVWAEAAEGTTGPSSGRTVQETEPNDTPATANLIDIGDGFVSVGESEIIEPNGNNDYFAFDGVQGTMVELREGRAQYPEPNPDFPVSTFSFYYLDSPSGGEGPLFTAPSLDDGTAPPLLCTLPRTTRYIIPGAFSGGPTTLVVFGSVNEFLPSPTSVARDHRDIVLTWSRDGGRTWSPKVRVNDDPPGADQAVPAVAVDEQGRVHVAWMDRRDGPLEGHAASPYWTASSDGGLTFAPSRRLASPGSDYHGFELGTSIGDFISLTTEGGTVYVVWPQMTQGWPTATLVRITDIPTSIAVSRFAVEPVGSSVRVSWAVEDAAGITGFVVHRAPIATEDYERTASVAPHGRGEYTFLDEGTQAGSGYRYRLEVIRGSKSSWEGPQEIVLPLGISTLAFERVGPNPFVEGTRLVVAVPERSRLAVRIYDIQGHEVRRLQDGETAAGRYALVWDGRDAAGRAVAPGVYHLRASGGGQVATRSLVRVR